MKQWLFRATTLLILFSQTSWAESTVDQLQQLQAQIAQLQNQIQAIQPTWVALDTNNPLAALDTTNLPYSLLQQQSQYPARLTLGGSFSAAAQTWNSSHFDHVFGIPNDPDSGSALAVMAANLDMLANLNSWSQAFIEVDGGFNGYSTYIPEALITVGNLNQSPFYMAAGNFYLPFGMFPGNGSVANTLESNAFASTNLNQVDVRFSTPYFSTTLAVFNGNNNLNDFVSSITGTLPWQRWTLNAGMGYLYDIRYSGSGIAAAYGTSQGRTNIATGLLQGGQNGAINANSSITYALTDVQNLQLAGEWITTTNSATVHGIFPGRMQSWSMTGSYNSPILTKNTTWAIDYSAVINMAGVPLQLPGPIDQQTASVLGMGNQWLAYAQSQVWNNVYLGPEFAWINFTNHGHTWESAVNISVYL